MIRSITDWEIILRGMDPKTAARRVLGDVYYYTARSNANERTVDEDHQQIANVLEAWYRLRDKQSL